MLCKVTVYRGNIRILLGMDKYIYIYPQVPLKGRGYE